MSKAPSPRLLRHFFSLLKADTPPTCPAHRTPLLLLLLRTKPLTQPTKPLLRPSTLLRPRTLHTRPSLHQQRYQTPADDPNFISLVDAPITLVRSGRRHNYGLLVLAIIPLTAFVLGTWQVQRLTWKTELIAKLEDRLVKLPLELPPRVDPEAVGEFDYRRVWTRGVFRHEGEMLIGPRMHDGENGYLVVTPLEREGGETILVNRGWISKKLRDQSKRPEGLPNGEVRVEGLLREPYKKNMFTPDNKPEKGEWYFPDVKEMAEWVGCSPIWIEETMKPDLLVSYDREAKGIPIGRAAEVNLRNNHTQYIFTWYSLALATSVMFWMVVRKPPTDVARRVRRSREW